MSRAAIAILLLAAALAGPVAAGEKKAAPKLTTETKSGAQITQENIVKMKIKTAQPVQPSPPNPPGPTFGGPSLPSLPSPNP